MLVLLPLVLLVAVIWDFQTGKIPNLLILGGISTGFIHLICNYNVENLLSHIPGILFPLIILFPLYKIGTLGAGDIKLFSLLGFYFSFKDTLFCIFGAFIAGAVLSFIILVWRRNFMERLLYFEYFFKSCISRGHLQYYYLSTDKKEEEAEKKSKIHFSLPIFISVGLFMLL